MIFLTPSYFLHFLVKKIAPKALSFQKKAVPLPSIFAKTSFINPLTYYESVRNRFHFNSRFV